MGTLGDEEPAAPANSEATIQGNIWDVNPKQDSRNARHWGLAASLLVVTALAGGIPLFRWQSESQQRAFSLANMRRIATGLQVYSQDWDYKLPPPLQAAAGSSVDWPHAIRPYTSPDDVFSSPTSPITPFKSSLRDPSGKRAINSSYALNARFWNTFAPGPFPIENLEVPEQTVLLVEAGRMAVNPKRPPSSTPQQKGHGVDTYFDTTDRIGNLFLYPSGHDGSLAVVAADGHGAIVQVLHYTREDGPHNTMYGRVGNNFYNWNGGHPNGEIDTPAHE